MPKFPFTNYHELNLDWILKKVNALFDASEENAQTIRTYNTRLTAAEQTATNANTAATAAQQLAYAASENADDALAVAGTADSKADSALTAATTAVGAAAGAMTTAQEARQIAGNAQSAAADAGALANDASNAAAAAQQTADTNAGNIANLQTAVDTLSSAVTEIDNKADVIIDSASGSIASFADGANDMPIRSLVVNIEPVQAGSVDPSPTNVRPITGHTGCSVVRTGKNLLNPDVTWTAGLRDDNGNIVSSQSHFTNGIKVNPSTSYRFSNIPLTTTGTWRVYFLQSDGTWISRTAANEGNAGTFTTPSNCGQIQLQIPAANSDLTATQLEIGSETTAFEPYKATTTNVSWQSAAGTVYGGTLDIISGVLTVNSLLWRTTWGAGTNSGTATDIRRRAFYPSVNADLISRDEGKCNVAPTLRQLDVIGAYFIYATQFYVTLPVDTPDSTAIELYYKTEQKQTYQLTAQQINTMLGSNNIYSDVGSIADVQYPADTKLYIDGKIAELQALVLEN